MKKRIEPTLVEKAIATVPGFKHAVYGLRYYFRLLEGLTNGLSTCPH